MGHYVDHKWRLVDETVDALRGRSVAFLERLVAAPSMVGNEAPAQQVVAAELARLGFAVRELEVSPDIETRPGAGVPQLPYPGRPIVAGELAGDGRSLLFNGHVDVVPPGEAERWSADPFTPRTEDGWLYGRGAGDMKGGFALALLAVEALQEAAPEALAGSLSFVSVLEEECTGNGTLASAEAGVLADAVLLPEPTNLELLLDGIGILWLELAVEGRSAHAHLPHEGANAIELALSLVEALRTVEREMNEDGSTRHALNLGTFHSGDWQSSIPGVARIGVRIGYPVAWSVEEAQARVVAAVERAVQADARLAIRPPQLLFNGFRAQGYSLPRDHELVRELSAAHAEVFGAEPAIQNGTATTDARYYLNQFGVPALCYGPRVRSIHGIDEAVELGSIAAGAKVVARFLARYYGAEP